MQRYFGNKVTYATNSVITYPFSFRINNQNVGVLTYSIEDDVFKVHSLNHEIRMFRAENKEDLKSKIKEYCDVREIKIRYELLEEHGVPHDKTFIMAIYLDEEEMGTGKGRNKKEAEQSAAKKALQNLDLIW